MITTPALDIPNAWRAAALPVGIVLMILLGLLQMIRTTRLVDAALALGLIVAVGLLLFAAKPLLMAMGNYK
ncbi:hypothetical protein, partial [Stenotrophomonas maltophilia]|uniref:hypothetical protein n=1 Tax=Stenotrophomonas maltophilia TaxID=40324 RepID=UPI001954CEB4